MDFGAILLILALLVGVVMFIGRPLFDRKADQQLLAERKAAQIEDHRHSTLLAERDRVLTALQELDFDNAVGKVPPEDYPVQRAGLLQSGAEILRQLDEIEQTGARESAEDRLESAVAARRADLSERPRLPSADQDDLEMLIASRRRTRTEKAAGFCPKCGRPVQKSDQFCTGCGAVIK